MAELLNVAGRGRVESENVPGCKPKGDILLNQKVKGDVAYLIRLREDFDTRITFHIKYMKDFELLDKLLRAAAEAEGSESAISVLPDLPTSGSRFGFRRNMSALGVGNFLDRQHEGLQNYISTICSQIPNLSADSNLQDFFPDDIPEKDMDQYKIMMLETHSSPTLAQVKGNWRVPGSERLWTVDEKGIALLDGKHRGAEYDIKEEGTKLELKIFRADGWEVDICRSTPDLMIWKLDTSDEELVWAREPEAKAAEHFKKLAAVEAPPESLFPGK